MDTVLDALLENAPTILALGEPTHGEPAFPQRRNEIFAALADRGFRSIALETDRIAAFAVDAYVSGRTDAPPVNGFSHNFGRFPANQELVAWMRAYNASHAEPLTFHGFDAPLETTSAPSPRPYLQELCSYVAPDRWSALDTLLGEDERWDEVLDPALSIGGSRQAIEVRAATDDLLNELYASASRLVAESSVAAWRRAQAYGTAARGLLRYHARAAVAGPDRMMRMLGVRDALMAQNLLDIRVAEQDRGPTFVCAHNRHLQRYPSRWEVSGVEQEWSGAGAILSALLGDRYAMVTGSLGGAPAGTYESALDGQGPGLFAAARVRELTRGLAPRSDVTPAQGYFPLTADDLDRGDAVLHVAPTPRPARTETTGEVPAGPSAKESAAQIGLFPDVTTVIATEAMGAPESNWGNYFFTVGDDSLRPFATIVVRDMPGFDEESRLDRADVYRLNLHVGREEFQKRFGFPPREFEARRDEFDFAALDRVLPHPVYGAQGWVCLLNPSATLPDAIALTQTAYGNARARQQRRQ